jgi:carotenoid cleavage dioxygenase-like enzyme
VTASPAGAEHPSHALRRERRSRCLRPRDLAHRVTHQPHFGPALKHGVRTARTELHDFGPGRASLEPVFVPRHGRTDEDEGYVMAYVYDSGRNASDVAILSA